MSVFGTTAVGIDIGDGTLKVVKLTRRGRKVKLVRAWRLPYYLEADPADAALAMLAGLWSQFGDGARLVVGAPDRHAFTTTLLVPTMEADQVADLVRYEILRSIGQPEDEVLIGHHVRKGVVEQQVHAFALQRREVDALRADLASRGLAFDSMETPGFALASFVEHERPWGRDRVLLGVGELATQLVLLTEDGLWARRLPLGLADAENAVDLAERLSAEIDAAARFFLPGDRTFEPQDLVLSEEGALDASLTGALKRITGRNVLRLGAFERIATPWRMDWNDQRPEETLCMATASGLALAGVGLGRFHCPALGGDPRRESARRLPLVAATVVLSAAGLLTATELAEARTAQLESTLSPDLSSELVRLDESWASAQRQRAGHIDEGEALLAIGRRRPATFLVRRMLALLAPLADERGVSTLHVESLWLAPWEPQRAGALSLTLHVDPSMDDTLGERLQRAFRSQFEDVRIRGPEAAPVPGTSRFVVEVTLR